MDIISEAGILAPVAIVIFVIGLVVCVRTRASAMQVGAPLAVVILAVGALGAAMGQHLVDKAVQSAPGLEERVLMLSIGTREASANFLIAGVLALLLVAIAFGLNRSREQ